MAADVEASMDALPIVETNGMDHICINKAYIISLSLQVQYFGFGIFCSMIRFLCVLAFRSL